MVSTRSSSRADSAGPEPTPTSTSTSTPSTPTPATRKRKPATSAPSTTTRRRAHRASAFEHTPTFWTLLWMAVSLPLVIWDTGYVLGRPHTMEGGAAHWPLWLPYKLYGEVDHIYGWKAFHANNGFTAAQGLLNVVETLMYAVYLWLWYSRGEATTHGRVVTGRPGALAVLIGFSAAVMTLSKTFLYCEWQLMNADPRRRQMAGGAKYRSQGPTSTSLALTTLATTAPLILSSSGSYPSTFCSLPLT